MEKQTPAISIVINNYNYAKFLEAAVDSALGQTHPCEVIVVDDGSGDGSRELLQQYTGRAKVILKENGGQPSAFNAGFAAATGDLIIFLDSDDLLHPDAAETALAAWSPDCSKVQFPLQIIGSDGRATGGLMPRARLSEGEVLPGFLATGRYISSPTSGNMFARSFLSQIFPVPEKTWEAADGYLNTAAPFYGRIGAVARPLGSYRVHGSGMTTVFSQGSMLGGKLEKLMRHAQTEMNLIDELARKKGVTISKRALVSHWMHIKLRIAYYKLVDKSNQRQRQLFTCSFSMLKSVCSTTELSFAYKLRYLLWTLGVAVSPRGTAESLVRFAFDPAPASKARRLLRRAW